VDLGYAHQRIDIGVEIDDLAVRRFADADFVDIAHHAELLRDGWKARPETARMRSSAASRPTAPRVVQPARYGSHLDSARARSAPPCSEAVGDLMRALKAWLPSTSNSSEIDSRPAWHAPSRDERRAHGARNHIDPLEHGLVVEPRAARCFLPWSRRSEFTGAPVNDAVLEWCDAIKRQGPAHRHVKGRQQCVPGGRTRTRSTATTPATRVCDPFDPLAGTGRRGSVNVSDDAPTSRQPATQNNSAR